MEVIVWCSVNMHKEVQFVGGSDNIVECEHGKLSAICWGGVSMVQYAHEVWLRYLTWRILLQHCRAEAKHKCPCPRSYCWVMYLPHLVAVKHILHITGHNWVKVEGREISTPEMCLGKTTRWRCPFGLVENWSRVLDKHEGTVPVLQGCMFPDGRALCLWIGCILNLKCNRSDSMSALALLYGNYVVCSGGQWDCVTEERKWGF